MSKQLWTHISTNWVLQSSLKSCEEKNMLDFVVLLKIRILQTKIELVFSD